MPRTGTSPSLWFTHFLVGCLLQFSKHNISHLFKTLQRSQSAQEDPRLDSFVLDHTERVAAQSFAKRWLQDMGSRVKAPNTGPRWVNCATARAKSSGECRLHTRQGSARQFPQDRTPRMVAVDGRCCHHAAAHYRSRVLSSAGLPSSSGFLLEDGFAAGYARARRIGFPLRPLHHLSIPSDSSH